MAITIEEATIAALQAAMEAAHLTAESLARLYLERIEAIDRTGPTLRSVQEINPDALAIAKALDDERRERGARGLLHGAVILAANLIAVAIGTETDGSIVCPAGVNGVVGIKPTVGLTSRAGVIPISSTQDTVGPFGRTVADTATVLGALTGVDPRDPATQASAGRFATDYTAFLGADGLRGARIGVPRDGCDGYRPKSDAIASAAIEVLKRLGAVVVDPVKIPHFDREALAVPERIVFLYEFKAGVNAYLAGLEPGAQARTLADVVAFNRTYPGENLPYFGQERLEGAEMQGDLTEPVYLEALATCRRLGATHGFDVAMDEHRLDALVAPTTTPAWPIDLVNGDPSRGSSAKSAALAGYPLVSVPAGEVQGLPVGITFMGRAFSEATLIRFASAFEAATQARRPPTNLAAIW